jgi:hypothetical protein
MRKKPILIWFAIFIVIAATLLDIGPLPFWLLSLDSHLINHLPPYEQLEIQGNMRTTILQALGGVTLISGAIVAWSQVVNANQTLALSKSTRVTEVFAKAVEQLSAEGLATRLGGIYALDKLARDDARERATVAAILSAFAREIPADPLIGIGADTQAAATLLASGIYAGNVDLSGARLRGANLRSANLQHALLNGTILSDADLTDADLSYTSLNGADLRQAVLTGVNFQYSNLVAADLGETVLSNNQVAGAITDGSTITQ